MALPGGIAPTDFSGMILTDLGRTVSRTPITKTLNSITGREALASGKPVNITAVFLRSNTSWMFDKVLKIEGGDAYIMVTPATTLNEQDLITVDSITYEIKNLVTISPAGTDFFKYANLFIKSWRLWLKA